MHRFQRDTHDKILGSPILIVDDSEVNRAFLEAALRKYGFHNLHMADNGKAALAMFSQLLPQLILLDLMMPEMDGFEVCRSIRRMPEGKTLPILVQTALTEEKERVKAFESGATDFVTKPLFPQELIARVRVHLENAHYLHDLLIYKARVEAELNAARDLQYSILPQLEEIRSIEAGCDVEIASHFEPSSEIGGDFWGIKQLGGSNIAFWMVDFSGHNVAAALNAFRLQAYIREDSPFAAQPGEYMSMLNEKLSRLLEHGQFATMFYGVIDKESDLLLYASAGSPHPILLRGQARTSAIINATGLPLGIAAQCYATQSVGFYPGDTIFFYSDALTETPDEKGGYIDERKLLSWIKDIDTSPISAVEELIRRFSDHNGGRLNDDLTMGVIRRLPEQQKERAYG